MSIWSSGGYWGSDSGSGIDESEKGAADGVATLDGSGLVPVAQLPAITITNTFVVANEAAMLALDAQTGDVALRTDTEENYILAGTDPSVLGDWQVLYGGMTAEVNDLSAAVTWANVPDGNITSSSVTQHAGDIDVGDLGDVNVTTPANRHVLVYDGSDSFDNRLLVEADISDLGSYLTAETNDLTAAVTWANVPDGNITSSSVTQHAGDIDVGDLGDVNVTTPANRHALMYDGVDSFDNRLLVEADISDLGSYLTAETNDLTAAVTWANVPDGNITEGSVTQHQAALSIAHTQITGESWIANLVEDTTPQLGGDLDVNGNDFVSTSNGDIEFRPNGTGSVHIYSPLRLYRDSVNPIAVWTHSSAAVSDSSRLGLARTRGSEATPADVVAGDSLGLMYGVGRASGGSFINSDIEFRVPADASALSGSNSPGEIVFRTTSQAQATRTEKLILRKNGLLQSQVDTYETLVSGDDDFVTKKWVEDLGYSASALLNVVEDTTPQLGGNLDVNGRTISDSDDNIVEITEYCNVSSAGGTGTLRVSGSIGRFLINRTGAGTDLGQWIIEDSGANRLILGTRNDANSSTSSAIWINRTGSGTSVQDIQFWKPLRAANGSGGVPAFSFSGATNYGMFYNSTATALGFASAGNERFRIESDGTLTVGTQTSYENLVTSDDDIPNKKYVDDAITAGGGGLSNVVEDTTPQLGGDLDTNGNDIVSSGANNLVFRPNATANRFQIIADGQPKVQIKAYNDTAGFSGAPLCTLQRGKGTEASPGAVSSGEEIGLITWVGQTSSSTAGTAAYILVEAAGSVSSGSMPSDMVFAVAKTGTYAGDDSTSRKLRIKAAGALTVEDQVNYENLVVSDDVIPNKKYVDDAITAGGFMTDLVDDTSPTLGGALALDGNSVTGGAGAFLSMPAASLTQLKSGSGYNLALAGGDGGALGGTVAITAGDGTATGGSITMDVGRDSTDGSTDGKVVIQKTSGSSAPELHLREAGTNGSSAVKLKAPNAMSADVLWTLPDAQQTSGMMMGIDLGEFTVAGLPSASTYDNCWAVATDASGGRTVVRSDGTNWKVIAVEGATVST